MDGTDVPTRSFRPSATSKAKHDDRRPNRPYVTGTTKYDKYWLPRFGRPHELQDQRESTSYHGFEICQQGVLYKQCQERRQTEIRGKPVTINSVMRDNGMVTARIQQAFIKVRSRNRSIWYTCTTAGSRVATGTAMAASDLGQ